MTVNGRPPKPLSRAELEAAERRLQRGRLPEPRTVVRLLATALLHEEAARKWATYREQNRVAQIHYRERLREARLKLEGRT